MFRLRAEAKALRFEMLVEGESVRYVKADEGKIRQTLINLLANAIKFTPRGQIVLRITLDQGDEDRLSLAAEIEDTGSGIAAGDVGSCSNRSANPRVILELSSSPGRGSIFRFQIPIEPGDGRVAVRRAAPRCVSGLCPGTPASRILVVDDQFENRDWLVKLLASIGLPVLGVESGADDFLAKPCLEDELFEKIGALLHLAYIYVETNGSGDPSGGSASLGKGTFADLPRELREEILDATTNGNKRLLDKLILQVRQRGAAGGADRLQSLADRYEYDALTQLLEEAFSGRPGESPAVPT